MYLKCLNRTVISYGRVKKNSCSCRSFRRFTSWEIIYSWGSMIFQDKLNVFYRRFSLEKLVNNRYWIFKIRSWLISNFCLVFSGSGSRQLSGGFFQWIWFCLMDWIFHRIWINDQCLFNINQLLEQRYVYDIHHSIALLPNFNGIDFTENIVDRRPINYVK